ncbi:MAG: DUF1295 domain-containing protein [Gammaproteobacteria bacterium]
MGPIRFIFPAFVLAMWVICGIGLTQGTWTGIHWAMLAVAHVSCAVIFRNFVFVFSYGYGISMMLLNLMIMVWRPVPAALIVGGLGLAYGIRLTWFVHARHHSGVYDAARRRVEHTKADTSADVPLPLRLFMWISCGWLMTFVAMPTWVAANTMGNLSRGTLAGASLMLAGLLLETIADRQKQRAKAVNPDQVVVHGLYSRVRHPNYLGEIIFQTGLLVVVPATLTAGGVADAGVTKSWAMVAGLLGPLYIVILMYFAARDQDRRQAERYGQDPAFRTWRQQSSMLLPGL